MHPAEESPSPTTALVDVSTSGPPVPAHLQSPLQPVAASERIATLDVLRGIALLGVLVANIWLWFSGALFLFPGLQHQLRQPSLDSAVFLLIGLLISGKALTTFSFLFGLGFAVQMTRAEARGHGIAAVYSRRLAVLLVLGIVHGVFLWYGDILATYALLGFMLLLFRHRRQRTLLVWAFVLIVAVPLALGTIGTVMQLNAADPDKTPAERIGEMEEENREKLERFTSGRYTDVVRGNLVMLRDMYGSPKALSMVMFLGIFLLGLYAGRRRVFEDVSAHRGLLRRVALWGLLLGVPATLASFGLRLAFAIEEIVTLPWFPLAMMASQAFGTVPFALGYIAVATLLLQEPRWRARLGVFAPVGRMALTNYLSQTVICLAIFYVGGLLGEFQPSLNLLIALVIFIVQMWLSAWWLQRYRFGPMEWVWRSVTYGTAQSMRREEVER